MTTPSPLAGFSQPASTWFTDVFAAPTPVQAGAWQAISQGSHALVVAPTGSGKTLAAFFHALDRLTREPRPEDVGTRVVYISPLKALGVDIERNLRPPLVGIQRTGERLGVATAPVTVGVRSGDTPASERSRLVRQPPDILITTPESLYLMLTSSARETLRDVQTVIIDEIHAMAGTKRGTHLALSLERLDLMTGRDVQRVALSATVRPLERVAAFLGGDRPVTVVAPPARKEWDVHVRLPVEDITNPPPPEDAEEDPLLAGPANDTLRADGTSNASLWPHVERQVYDLVMAGRSTLVFTNSRRVAERLTARLNEIWAEEHDPDSLVAPGRRPPAQLMASADEVGRAPTVIARAHHGSVSKEARAEIESALKSGELRCVVATSSLELGIDMGSVDRVVQISAPPSVASALQRVGRAGHLVGAVSTGEVFPMHRGDLASSVVATERMLAGEIEELNVPRNPLDVLAQQTVAAAVAAGEAGLRVEDWYRAVTRSLPYAGLERAALDSVVELLTGTYPSADFGDLRARLVDEDGTLHARPGALRLATTSGGTIPDRGMFGVFLVSDETGARRVGELDEEMVYESRVGDVFTLGASSWRIEEITRDQVRVTPAPGHTGRLPFWHGDAAGRPAELGRALGRFQREAARDPARLEQPFIDANTRANLSAYLAEQKEATGLLPDDQTVVLEQFRDEVGDWRFVLHSPVGRGVLGAWALVIGERISRLTGIDASPVASDDGIIWRMPDSEAAEQMAELVLPDPDDVERIVTEQVGGTALFASRFRECAARALLLPRRNPGRRAPLWQQRQRASQLLEVARLHPRFPIIIETVREVLQDVYDVPALVELATALERGAVRLVSVTTEQPSPFAATMLFRYTGAFMYEGDTPLAERRAATLSMDPALLASVLGTVDLRDLLDPAIITAVEAELQHTAPERRITPLDGVPDLLRMLGPVALDDLRERLDPTALDELGGTVALGAARVTKRWAGQVHVVQVAGRPHLVASSDLGLLRDALGIPLPPGVSAPDSDRDPLTQLIARHARTHAPFTTAQVAAAFGLGPGTAQLVLERELAAGRLVRGHFTPGVSEPEFSHPEVLRRIRQRALSAARAQVQPASQTAYARFLCSWHQTDDPPTSNPDEVLLALQRLAGVALPASAWETHVLPARLRDYQPAHLDELIAEGEVLIRFRGATGSNDPLLALVPRDDIDLLTPVSPDAEAQAVAVELTGAGGLAHELRRSRERAVPPAAQDAPTVDASSAARTSLVDVDGSPQEVTSNSPQEVTSNAAGKTPPPTPAVPVGSPGGPPALISDAELTDLVWSAAEAGAVAPVSMAPVRARLGGSTKGAHKAPRQTPRRRARLPRAGLLARPGGDGAPPAVAGRWYAVADPELGQAEQALARVSAWLERYGVVTRGAVMASESEGGFAAAYRLLTELEQAGKVMRGYVVEGLGGSQFATSSVIHEVRRFADSPDASAWPSGALDPAPVVLAALDPANPYGSVLSWPEHPTARPSRAAGALVVLADGVCLAHLTRGGRNLTLFTPPHPEAPSVEDRAQLVASALVDAASQGRLGRLRIEELDGERLPASVAAAMRSAGARPTPSGVIIEASQTGRIR